ncbi:MAG: hypothetical protein ABJA90_04390 [Ginsengibacter sp.]
MKGIFFKYKVIIIHKSHTKIVIWVGYTVRVNFSTGLAAYHHNFIVMVAPFNHDKGFNTSSTGVA